SRRQLRARVVQPKLVTADVGHVFERDSTLVGTLQDQLVNRALTDDRVAVRAETGVQQELDDVLQADPRAIQQVLAVARAVQPARDTDLFVVYRQAAVGVVERQRDFGHRQRLALFR